MSIFKNSLRVAAAGGLLIGGIALFGGFFLDLGIIAIPSSVELPLSDLRGVVVDSKGRVYCGSQFLRRIQIYNEEGRFLRGWSVPDQSGGVFLLKLDSEDRLHIGTFRSYQHYVFDVNGKLLNQKKLRTGHMEEFEGGDPYRHRDKNDNLYEIRSGMLFPHVVRIKPSGATSVIVSTPLYLWFFQGPFPAWLFWMFGCLAYWQLQRKPSSELQELKSLKKTGEHSNAFTENRKQMLWIPYQRFEIQTSLESQLIREKMEALTENPSWRMAVWPPKEHKPFVGKISESGFKIRRVIHYRNSFLPILCGQIDGSVLQITARFHIAAAIFMSVWFGGILFAFLASFLPIVDSNTPTSPHALRISMIPFLIFGYLICALPFHFELKKAKKILGEAFA